MRAWTRPPSDSQVDLRQPGGIRPRAAGRRRPLYRAADLHGDARAARGLLAERGTGTLWVPRRTREPSAGTTSSAALPPDLSLWLGPGGRRARGHRPRPRRGHWPGHARAGRRGPRVIALDIDRGAARPRWPSGPPAWRCARSPGRPRSAALTDRDLPLVIAPMQTIQLLGGESGRARDARRVRRHMAPAAAGLRDRDRGRGVRLGAGDPAPAPGRTRRGAIFVSRAVAVRGARRGPLERVREAVRGRVPPAVVRTEADGSSSTVSPRRSWRGRRSCGFQASALCASRRPPRSTWQRGRDPAFPVELSGPLRCARCIRT